MKAQNNLKIHELNFNKKINITTMGTILIIWFAIQVLLRIS